MQSAMENICKRVSVRTYDKNKPVDPEARAYLEKLVQSPAIGPFGNSVRFYLLDLGELPQKEIRPLGTYGVIRGAGLYLLGAVIEAPGNMEDLGYCMEKVILEATALGLGTCWLAGTFRRSSFARHMELSPGELLPAITPVGYPASHKRLLERVMKIGSASHRRKPWNQLFFLEDYQTPLPEEEAGPYQKPLEAVRLGPSSTNRQPWRIIKDRKDMYHLYLKENPTYNRALHRVRLQNIDMGIAMLHFELVAQEKGLPGRWEELKEAPSFPGLTYISSWMAVKR